jgi:hypothetical protein
MKTQNLSNLKTIIMKRITNSKVKTTTPKWLLLVVMVFMTKNLEASNFFVNNSSNLTIERHRVWINVTDSSTGAFSQTLFGYRTGATDGYDPGLDGAYFNDGAIALTSLIGADRYTIQFKGLNYNLNDVVPLSFTTNYSGNFTFAFDHADGFFLNNSQPVYILDTQTNIYTNIKNANYTFSSTNGMFNDRFKLVFYNPNETASLGTTEIFTSSSLVVVQQQENIFIKTGNTVLESVAVYNLNGQIIYQNYNVDDNELVISNLRIDRQPVIIRAITKEGIMVSKKWLYYR